MTLALKYATMNSRLPYKELSLLTGVLTAAIILGLFIMESGILSQNPASASAESYVQMPTLLKLLADTAAYFIK